MKKRILALLLVLILGLSLAACSAPAAESSEQPSADPSAQVSDTIEVDLTQDILAFSAGLSAGDVMATVNGEAVNADFFLYWLAINTSYYSGYGLTPDLYGDIILSESLTMAAYYNLLQQKAAELGCPLTDEQTAAVQATLDEAGEVAVQRQMAMFGLTEETIWDIQSLMYYYENLIDATIPTPSEEELNNYVYQAKHILIATATEGSDGTVTLSTGEAATNEDGTPFTGTAEEYNAAAQAKAEDILAQIRASEDPAATFDALMHEHSQDGRDAEGNLGAPDGYTTPIGQMVAEFDAGALALEIGGISDPVKSDFGYHIILRGEVENIDSYSEAYREYMMDQQVNTWLNEAEIVETELMESLDVADFFSRFVAYQTKLSEQYAAEDAE